jgi:hypothetical protein
METQRRGIRQLHIVDVSALWWFGSFGWRVVGEWSEAEPRRREARRPSSTAFTLPFSASFWIPYYGQNLSYTATPEMHGSFEVISSLQTITKVDCLRPASRLGALLCPNHLCVSLLLLPFVVLHSLMIFHSPGRQMHEHSDPPLIFTPF